MPVVCPSKTWRRYMPAFWRPCLGDDDRQRDERPAVARPGGEHRQTRQVGRVDDDLAPSGLLAVPGAVRGELLELTVHGQQNTNCSNGSITLSVIFTDVGTRPYRCPGTYLRLSRSSINNLHTRRTRSLDRLQTDTTDKCRQYDCGAAARCTGSPVHLRNLLESCGNRLRLKQSKSTSTRWLVMSAQVR